MNAVITIDVVDVVEAAELASFVKGWLAQAGPAVVEDFTAFASPYTIVELRAELVALAASLAVTEMGQR